MEDKIGPAVKLLIGLSKDQLLYKACRYRLVSVKHKKQDLAEAIAKYEDDKAIAGWEVIVNGQIRRK